jgi:hypothetical protein
MIHNWAQPTYTKPNYEAAVRQIPMRMREFRNTKSPESNTHSKEWREGGKKKSLINFLYNPKQTN